MLNITMIGAGYVGLVTGACLAELGHKVTCVDLNSTKINLLQAGDVPIYEAGLKTLIERAVDAGRLQFSLDLELHVAESDAVFICVETPTAKKSDSADLSFVYAAARDVAQSARGFTVVITKSTVPVGTNEQVLNECNRHLAEGAEIAVASNPEFLREGSAVHDFFEPDRIVVGVSNDRARNIMSKVYKPLVDRNVPLLMTDIRTAEMIKYSANGFLAIKLSFINEVADLCEAVGANINDLSLGIGLDKRIGKTFLSPGPGWGGSCFPKDSRAFRSTGLDHNVDLKIIDAAIKINEDRKLSMVNRIVDFCNGSVENKKVAVLGLTFKGQTDDMRESPSISILSSLVAMGAKVHAFDPSNSAQAARHLPMISIKPSAEDAIEGADVLVIMTEWREFVSYDYSKFSKIMETPIMIDLRNLLDKDEIIKSGFTQYKCLGTIDDAGLNETG